MRVALDRHQLGDLDAADLADAPQVVAAEVHQHHVLGALLLARSQLLLHPPVGRLIAASPPGARNWPVAQLATLHRHQDLRRCAEDGRRGQLEEIHVGRGVERS